MESTPSYRARLANTVTGMEVGDFISRLPTNRAMYASAATLSHEGAFSGKFESASLGGSW